MHHECTGIKRICLIVFFSLILVFKFTFASSSQTTQYLLINTDVKTFMKHMEKKYHFKKNKLSYFMKHAKYFPAVIALVKQPFEKKPWNYYHDYFVSEKYIRPGAVYWEAHKKILAKVSKKYGVNPAIIVAIIGIESYYGLLPGKYQEIGALSTLAFYYPPRSNFFKKELSEYLILSRDENLSVLKVTGSYAGAIGIPQFMPSSYRMYGIRFSKSGKINLINDHADAIASIANYLKKAGWRAGQPIAIKARTPAKIDNQLISNNAFPNISLNKLAKHHIYPEKKLSSKSKVALIKLNETKTDIYWITFPNFYAIMRYNPSTNYAMAVYQLSQAIQDLYEKRTD